VAGGGGPPLSGLKPTLSAGRRRLLRQLQIALQDGGGLVRPAQVLEHHAQPVEHTRVPRPQPQGRLQRLQTLHADALGCLALALALSVVLLPAQRPREVQPGNPAAPVQPSRLAQVLGGLAQGGRCGVSARPILHTGPKPQQRQAQRAQQPCTRRRRPRGRQRREGAAQQGHGGEDARCGRGGRPPVVLRVRVAAPRPRGHDALHAQGAQQVQRLRQRGGGAQAGRGQPQLSSGRRYLHT